MMCAPKETFLVVGGGSHAHRVAEAICASGGTVVAFATSRGVAMQNAGGGPSATQKIDEALERFPGAAVVVAIGDCEARRTLIERLRRLERRLPPIIHPQATVSPGANVGEGVVILTGAVVEWSAVVGEGSIIDVHAVICHEARVEPMSHIQPGTIVGPRAQVPRGTRTGIGARILADQG